MSKKWQCTKCGKIAHATVNPGNIAGKCSDTTSGKHIFKEMK